MSDSILQGMERSEVTLLVLSDLRRCFDVVVSETQDNAIGTFLGSSLGPLLYNIFSNDISCFVPTHIDGFPVKLVKYADDAQLAITGPRDRLTDMIRAMESVLDKASTWFLQNGMMVNAGKTEMLLCGDTRQLRHIDPPSITFMEQTLKCSKT